MRLHKLRLHCVVPFYRDQVGVFCTSFFFQNESSTYYTEFVILKFKTCFFSLSHRYYYDKDILAKIQGKRYAYQFNFKALSLACQAQQTPTPSDAKLEDLSTILAPLLNPATSSTSVKNG